MKTGEKLSVGSCQGADESCQLSVGSGQQLMIELN